MRIIAVTNQKGGCAKTTTVVNLAAGLSELGKKVLVIDLDPQANSTQWLGVGSHEKSSYDLLASTHATLESVIQPSSIEGVDTVSAAKELVNLEKVLIGELAIEGRLARKLKNLTVDSYDFVLIDTPPTLGLLTMNACVAATELLVPVTTHVLTLAGVSQLISKFNEITEIVNPGLKILGFLPSRVDLRTRHSRDVLNSLKERFGQRVFDVFIRDCVFLAEAPSFGESIFKYKPKSSAADDFRALALDVVSRVAI